MYENGYIPAHKIIRFLLENGFVFKEIYGVRDVRDVGLSELGYKDKDSIYLRDIRDVRILSSEIHIYVC